MRGLHPLHLGHMRRVARVQLAVFRLVLGDGLWGLGDLFDGHFASLSSAP
jgi:hypothetical protein